MILMLARGLSNKGVEKAVKAQQQNLETLDKLGSLISQNEPPSEADKIRKARTFKKRGKHVNH